MVLVVRLLPVDKVVVALSALRISRIVTGVLLSVLRSVVGDKEVLGLVVVIKYLLGSDLITIIFSIFLMGLLILVEVMRTLGKDAKVVILLLVGMVVIAGKQV